MSTITNIDKYNELIDCDTITEIILDNNCRNGTFYLDDIFKFVNLKKICK